MIAITTNNNSPSLQKNSPLSKTVREIYGIYLIYIQDFTEKRGYPHRHPRLYNKHTLNVCQLILYQSYSHITSNSSTIKVLPPAPLNKSPSLLEEQTIANLYLHFDHTLVNIQIQC